MASGCSVWIVLLAGAVVISTVSCGIGTPCKVLCEDGEEMIICETKMEIFKCRGPCSEPTCDDPNPTQECEKGYKAGCFCRDGYVRSHAGGSCVPIENCPNKY